MSNGEPNWAEINLKKQIAIIRGQTSNQAFSFIVGLIDKKEVDKWNKNNSDKGFYDSALEVYEQFYNKLLPINLKLLNGGVGTTENKPIPEVNVPVGHSTTVPEKKPVNPNAFNDNNKKNDNNDEVGAGWLDKKKPGVLNCKDNKTGAYSNVKIDEMEKDGDDLIYEGFRFVKIPNEQRPNPKMPNYRTFLEEDNDK